MSELAVFAVGRDRPGIVAGVTEALANLQCNLSDTSMTLLRGQFAMIVLVSPPESLSVGKVRESLQRVAERLELVLAVHEVQTAATTISKAYVLSVHGADHPGIVHRFAAALARRSVNIVNLFSHLIGEDAKPVYTMVLEIDLPAGVDEADLRDELVALAAEVGVEANLRPADDELL